METGVGWPRSLSAVLPRARLRAPHPRGTWYLGTTGGTHPLLLRRQPHLLVGAAEWRARAHAELGNALRVLERYPEAEASFRVVEVLLAEVQAPEQRAEIFSLLASLHADQRRFEQAKAALEEALSLARAMGNQRLETKLLVTAARVFVDGGAFQSAKKAVVKAGDYLVQDPWDPLLVVMAMGNGIYTTIEEAGQTKDPGKRLSLLDQALVMAEDAEPMFERHARPQERLQLQWYTGRLLVHEGKLGAAERKLDGIVDRFLALERPAQAAYAGLDLCLIHSRQGDAVKLRKLATRCYAALTDAGLPVAMLVAFRFLRKAQDLLAAESVILLTLQKLGAPLFGTPRASRGMNP